MGIVAQHTRLLFGVTDCSVEVQLHGSNPACHEGTKEAVDYVLGHILPAVADLMEFLVLGFVLVRMQLSVGDLESGEAIG